MTREKFKLELEVEIEYNMEDNDIATYPYTQVKGYVDRDGVINIVSTAGKIVDFTPLKLEHIEKGNR